MSKIKIIGLTFAILFCFFVVARSNDYYVVYADDTPPAVDPGPATGDELPITLEDGTVIIVSPCPSCYEGGDPGVFPGHYPGQLADGTWVWVSIDTGEIVSPHKPRCYGYWHDVPGTRSCGTDCGKVTCTVQQNDGCGHDQTITDDQPGFNQCLPTISDWGACDANHKSTRTCTDNDGLFYDLNGDGFATGSGEDADDCASLTVEKDCIGVIQGTLFDASDLSSCNLGTVGNAATLGIVATGGTITHDGAYTVHTFTTSGTFSVSQAGFADVLVVAGGGAGGATRSGGGGGGGGGVVYRANQTIPIGSFHVSVGAGGPGASLNSEYKGSYGGSSSFMNMLALGGGPGGGGQSSMGGSGGGAANSNPGPKMQTDSGGGTGYGHVGGMNQYSSAGGGGGAGEPGHDGVYQLAQGGEGGNGFESAISGTRKYYGGGGGGLRYHSSSYDALTSAAAGGEGGGGNGGTYSYYGGYMFTPTDGAANTGGGGGGCYGKCPADGYGASGGSGVVIIRYLTRPLNQLLPTELALPSMNNFQFGIAGTWPLIDPPVTTDENGNYYEPVYASAVSPTYSYDFTDLLASDKVAGIKLQCQGADATVTQNNQVVTKDVGFWRVYGGWWQVTGGNVYATSGIHSNVPASLTPATNQKLILTNADGASGVLSYGTAWDALSLGTNPDAKVSDPLWRIESKYEGLRYDYDFYDTKMDVYESTPWNGGTVEYGDSGLEYQIFKHTGNVTLDYAGPTGSQKVILMVNGNVTINNDVVVPNGSFLAVIAKGNITFGTGASKAQGMFVAENINIPCKDTESPLGTCDKDDIQFEGEGSFIGWSGINMGRDRFKTNNQEPSEKFAYRSDLLLAMPTPMKVFTKKYSPFVP